MSSKSSEEDVIHQLLHDMELIKRTCTSLRSSLFFRGVTRIEYMQQDLSPAGKDLAVFCIQIKQ